MRINQMKVNSGNSTIHSGVDSEKSCAKWTGPEFDAAKNIHNDSDASQARNVAMDAKGTLNTNGALRRSVIDQDLDQPDMAASIKQQILEYPSGNR
jgi:hypothetical protein